MTFFLYAVVNGCAVIYRGCVCQLGREDEVTCTGIGLDDVPQARDPVLSLDLRDNVIGSVDDDDIDGLRAEETVEIDLRNQRGVRCVVDARLTTRETSIVHGICPRSMVSLVFP